MTPLALEPHEVDELKNLIFGGAAKRVTSDQVAGKLVERGLVRRVVGGLVATELGQHSFAKHHGK